MPKYDARTIYNGHILDTRTFDASNDKEAWALGNHGVEILKGFWVEVRRQPEPARPPIELPPAKEKTIDAQQNV